jgi:hypothetical protein
MSRVDKQKSGSVPHLGSFPCVLAGVRPRQTAFEFARPNKKGLAPEYKQNASICEVYI